MILRQATLSNPLSSPTAGIPSVRRSFVAVLLLFLFLVPGLNYAQACPATATPDEVAAAVLRSWRNGDGEGILRLTDKSAMPRVGQRILQIAEALHRISGRAVRSPDISSAAVFGVGTFDEVTRLAPETLLVRFAEFGIERKNDLDTTNSSVSAHVVGYVTEGDSVAYALLKYTRVGDGSATEHDSYFIDVMTLKRRNCDAWRSMLDGGIIYGSTGFSASVGVIPH